MVDDLVLSHWIGLATKSWRYINTALTLSIVTLTRIYRYYLVQLGLSGTFAYDMGMVGSLCFHHGSGFGAIRVLECDANCGRPVSSPLWNVKC